MIGRTAWILGVLLTLAACASARETAEPVEDAEELPVPAVDMSVYEEFDPAPYAESPIRPAADFEHDVPTRLMEGRADEGVRSEVQGFRVQVHSSLDKTAAVEIEEAAKEWWAAEEAAAPDNIFRGGMEIYVVYIQPYYRVRVGNFTSRQAAERARQYVARRFPDAFIVPDTVTITR